MELARDKKFRADLLVCPGDITNRASREGLSSGFEFLREMERELNCSHLICTLGNHDVDSRKTVSKDPFGLAHTVHPCYPMPGKENSAYWGEGFAVIEFGGKAILVVLNTVLEHIDEPTAKRGTFSDYRLDALNKYLEKYKDNKLPFRVAILHHHPLLHSDFEDVDVLVNGDQLVGVLAKHKMDIILHGHKHQPRLRRHSIGGHNMLVFAAGSFSAFLKKISSTTRNLFHILTLNFNLDSCESFGVLETWEYNWGQGWSPASRKSAGLPHLIKYKKAVPDIRKENVTRLVESHTPNRIIVEELYREIPSIEYMLPDEFETLSRELERDYGIKFEFDQYGSISGAGKIVR